MCHPDSDLATAGLKPLLLSSNRVLVITGTFIFFRRNIKLVVKPECGTLLDQLGGYSYANLLEMAACPASEVIVQLGLVSKSKS